MYDDEKIITLESYYDPMEAEIVRGRLQAEGIPCFIADTNTVGVQPLYNVTIGGVKLKIFEHDLAKCQEILSENNESSLTPGIEQSPPDHTCPHCHSNNIRYGSATVRKTSWLVFFISLITALYPFYARKAWHCFNCGKDFI